MMIRIAILAAFAAATATQGASAQQAREDTLATSAGDLVITLVGHGSLMFRHAGKVVHVDPVMREADYAAMPKADLILVTHRHGDHLDREAIAQVRKEGIPVVVASDCSGAVESAMVMENGASQPVAGLHVEAIPAYNLVHKRDSGDPYHPKGDGNGYLITFGDTRVYVAGDTENTPEMKALQNIEVAFLPMNVPYTMTPQMVADAAKAFRPRILYPYHYGDTDSQELVRLLQSEPGIEVRLDE